MADESGADTPYYDASEVPLPDSPNGHNTNIITTLETIQQHQSVEDQPSEGATLCNNHSDRFAHPPCKSSIFVAEDDSDYTVIIAAVSDEDEETGDAHKVDEQFYDANLVDLAKPIALKVNKDVLTQSSSWFARVLYPSFGRSWKETKQGFIKLSGDRADTMRLLFEIIHGREFTRHSLATIPVSQIYHLIAECDKYQIQMTGIKLWFDKWYNSQQEAILSRTLQPAELLLPTHYFNHAKGFAGASKKLVLDTYGAFDLATNPTSHHELRVSDDVISKIYAVRGHLQKRIVEDILKIKGGFNAGDRCSCHYQIWYDFEEEMRHLEIWPFSCTNAAYQNRYSRQSGADYEPRFDTDRQSLYAVIQRLLNEFKAPNIDCPSCRGYRFHKFGNPKQYMEKRVKDLANRCREYFDGLCLDCMDGEKRKTDLHPDEEILHRGDMKKVYADHTQRHDFGCRINHGQPTEYYSMGLREQNTATAADRP